MVYLQETKTIKLLCSQYLKVLRSCFSHTRFFTSTWERSNRVIMLGTYSKRYCYLRPECVLAYLLLSVQTVLLAWAATRHSPSIDEVGHLPAGLAHWQLGNFDMYRVNPPLVRTVATFPVFLAKPKIDLSKLSEGYRKQLEFSIGRDFIVTHGQDSFWYFTLARWACLPFSLIGGLICFLWARELYGCLAGLLALSLWCFCPNILGHAQMITPDAGAAALGVAAGYTFWRWLRFPCWERVFLAGGALGLAELTKSTWIILFSLWPLLWLFWKGTNRQISFRTGFFREGLQVSLILGFALYLLNLGYGFEGSFEPLGHYDFVSDALRGPKLPMPQSTNRFENSWLGMLPVPLPRPYLLGIDEQKRDFERTFLSYLRGEWRQGGWWYYYLYGLAVKVPLGTWILLLLATVATMIGRYHPILWRHERVLLAPAGVVLILVSSQTGFNHHLRYVLPMFPFVFVWASKVAQPRICPIRYAPVLVLSAVLWSTTSSLWIYPHSLSYFNELAGGPTNGHAHLVDSNIDWGQDLLYLKRWLDEHPEARPLGLAYFGYFDPRVAGIDFSLPPKGPVATSPVELTECLGPRPGWYAISVTLLRGYRYTIYDGRGGFFYTGQPYYSYFQRF